MFILILLSLHQWLLACGPQDKALASPWPLSMLIPGSHQTCPESEIRASEALQSMSKQALQEF